jgi:hypothetical protein
MAAKKSSPRGRSKRVARRKSRSQGALPFDPLRPDRSTDRVWVEKRAVVLLKDAERGSRSIRSYLEKGES